MTLGDGTKPAFMTSGPASQDYPGETEEPTFDPELEFVPGTLPAPAGDRKPSAFESRWIMIAQMNARGYSNAQIAKQLGYTPAGVGKALLQPFTQAEIVKERARLLDTDAIEIMKRTSVHAARRLERAVLDPDHEGGDDVAKFVLEKVTGKATQQISHDVGSPPEFMAILKSMQQRGESIDVTGTSKQVSDSTEVVQDVKPEDSVSNWIETNL